MAISLLELDSKLNEIRNKIQVAPSQILVEFHDVSHSCGEEILEYKDIESYSVEFKDDSVKLIIKIY